MTPWGVASLEPRGLISRIYVGDRPLNIGIHRIFKRWASRFQRRFLSFFHYKSMGANDPQGVASLDPRVLIGRICVGNTKHCYTLNI